MRLPAQSFESGVTFSMCDLHYHKCEVSEIFDRRISLLQSVAARIRITRILAKCRIQLGECREDLAVSAPKELSFSRFLAEVWDDVLRAGKKFLGRYHILIQKDGRGV